MDKHFTIRGNAVHLSVDGKGLCSVSVNKKYDYANLPRGVGAVIILKCIRALKEFMATPEAPRAIWCSAYDEDRLQERRKDAFWLAGFRSDDGVDWVLRRQWLYYVDIEGQRI